MAVVGKRITQPFYKFSNQVFVQNVTADPKYTIQKYNVCIKYVLHYKETTGNLL